MTIFLASGGAVAKPLLIGPGGQRLLYAPLRTTSGGGSGGGSGGSGSLPTGAGAHWDASTTANMLASSGSTVTGWQASVANLADTTGNTRPLAPFFGLGSGTNPVATSRLNGTLGGVGRNTVVPPGAMPSSGQYLPVMDPDQGFRLSGVTFGASSDWSIFLAWSRPNLRQGYSGDVTLVTIGTTKLITMSATGFTLMPGTAGAAAFGTVARRHSAGLILSYASGSGVLTATYLNGSTPVSATASASSIGSGGLLTLLHDTTANGGAQCWLHEAAYWSRAMTSGDMTNLEGYAGRWTFGARLGFGFVAVGQSNSQRYYEAGAMHLLAQGIGWYLGALACNVFGTDGGTMVGGNGTVPDVFPGYTLGSFFSNSAATTLSSQGTNTQSYLTALSSADLADVTGIFWPWNETDSMDGYAYKSTINNAWRNLITDIRSWAGKSATQLPSLTWNAMPFPYLNDGMQMVRECEYDLTQISGFNSHIIIPNTSGCTPIPGETIHLEASSYVAFSYLGASAGASAILTSTGGDIIKSLSGMPINGGPSITHVKQISATQYQLTITHDQGTDIIIPSGAASGAGFAMADGWTMATWTSSDTPIQAVSCTYVDSTHILITLASAPVSSVANLRLYYSYGFTVIGTGNVVTDNYSTLNPAISTQLGAAWAPNFPLAATTYGIPVSSS